MEATEINTVFWYIFHNRQQCHLHIDTCVCFHFYEFLGTPDATYWKIHPKEHALTSKSLSSSHPSLGKNTDLSLHYVTVPLDSLIFQQVTCFWSCNSKAGFEGWVMPLRAQPPCLPPWAKASLCPQHTPFLCQCYSFGEADAWRQSKALQVGHWTLIYKDNSTPVSMIRMLASGGRKTTP